MCDISHNNQFPLKMILKYKIITNTECKYFISHEKGARKYKHTLCPSSHLLGLPLAEQKKWHLVIKSINDF